MERIGTQVNLPWKIVLQITLQGIKIRLGRALVTLSGVVLGIAFLMNVITGELIKRTVSNEQKIRAETNLMSTLVGSEMGNAKGKIISIVASGKLSVPETKLIDWLVGKQPDEIRVIGYTAPGLKSSTPAEIGKDSYLLLIMGADKALTSSIAELTAGMKQSIVIDTLSDRQYIASDVSKVKMLNLGTAQAAADEKAKIKQQEDSARAIWVVAISMLVTVIGIANALLMSVTERFKEIGTMKCLGALSVFIRRLFLLESGILGLVGSIFGVLLGVLVPMLAFGAMYGMKLVFGAMDYPILLIASFGTLITGVLLSMLAAIYPANFAARMIPAMALRSNV
jgi:ABC-type antimicrobial peptide transport system permease subunit